MSKPTIAIPFGQRYINIRITNIQQYFARPKTAGTKNTLQGSKGMGKLKSALTKAQNEAQFFLNVGTVKTDVNDSALQEKTTTFQRYST